MKKRDFQLIDTSDTQISVTLWTKQAEEFGNNAAGLLQSQIWVMLTLQSSKSLIVHLLILKVKYDSLGYNIIISDNVLQIFTMMNSGHPCIFFDLSISKL